jgi:hypothetical protein
MIQPLCSWVYTVKDLVIQPLCSWLYTVTDLVIQAPLHGCIQQKISWYSLFVNGCIGTWYCKRSCDTFPPFMACTGTEYSTQYEKHCKTTSVGCWNIGLNIKFGGLSFTNKKVVTVRFVSSKYWYWNAAKDNFLICQWKPLKFDMWA